jgi:hypothetical protein
VTSESEDPRLGAEDEELVRRLLGASGSEPTVVPEDVATRLDDVLAGLVADRAEQRPVVTPIAERRRRRWPNVLVAAAVLSVVAIGVGTLTRLGAGSAGDNASAGVAADAPAQAEKAPAGGADSGAAAARPLPDLHRDSLRTDVRRVAAHEDRRTATLTDNALRRKDAAEGDRRSPGCAVPETSVGDRLVPVRLDGERSTLVLRKEAHGTREAQVYACDDAQRVVVQTSVPAP